MGGRRIGDDGHTNGRLGGDQSIASASASLAGKIERQVLVEMDRMNFTRENYRMMCEAVLKVVP
jgi:hypothetical protein